MEQIGRPNSHLIDESQRKLTLLVERVIDSLSEVEISNLQAPLCTDETKITYYDNVENSSFTRKDLEIDFTTKESFSAYLKELWREHLFLDDYCIEEVVSVAFDMQSLGQYESEGLPAFIYTL